MTIAKQPRTVKEIQEQLADFALVKASAEAYGERDFASKLALRSIREHEQELLAELHAAEALAGAATGRGPTVGTDRSQETKLTVQGMLVAGNIEARRFELRTADTIYRGVVADSAAADMTRSKLGAMVEAELQVCTFLATDRATVLGPTYSMMSMTSLRAAARAVPATRGVRAVSAKHLVYVHGICEHPAGYSDPWFEALKNHTDTIADANRHEVLWSDVVTTPSTRGVAPRRSLKEVQLAETIKDVLEDRVQRTMLDEKVLPSASSGSLRGVNTRAVFGIPGLDCIDDFMKYMTSRSIRAKVLERFTEVVQPLLESGADVDIISHSWGTVVAYEGLRELEAAALPGKVPNLFTVGSALSIAPVRRFLEGNQDLSASPTLVSRWINVDAKGDPVGGSLRGTFPIDEEFLGLEPVGCSTIFGIPSPACAHSSYFDANNDAVNRDIFAHFIES